jgi:3-oxoacyl-[acyl-carrier-protein] synthase II
MRAVVTGLGAVTAYGRGVRRLWEAMAAAENGIQPIERFSTDGYDVHLAGMVPDRNTVASRNAGAELHLDFAIDAAREASVAAGLAGLAADRIALVVGSGLGDHELALHRVTELVGDAIGVRGPRLTVSTACTSSTNALGLALDLLEQGAADAVVAGGADMLTPLVFAGFHALGVLSPKPCAPFSQPSGTSLGEGAGFVVLERDARRVPARFVVLGYGLSADGYHETSPDPSGTGIARSMRAALAHAGVEPDAIDYVNAHGTGTVAGDPAEWRAIRQLLGARADGVPVSSSKSFLGHAQGAAGVVELIATLLALEHGTVPPTRNFAGPRPNSPPDPVAGDRPRPADVRFALCNSSGFGGANCAVIVSRTGRDEAGARSSGTSEHEQFGAGPGRPVYVASVAAASPRGMGLEALLDQRAGEPLVLPGIDPRGLDPMTRYLVAASAKTLTEAGVRVRGAMQDRTGLVAGTTRVSSESEAALRRSIDERGLRFLSATMFSRMVLNAPIGACSKLLGFKGPFTTITAGDASGLAAIIYAAHLLATRDDTDRIIAGGVEEHRPEPGSGTLEGAACVLLATAPPQHGPRVRLAGFGLAGPGAEARAIAKAIEMAGGGPFDLAVAGSATASTSAARDILAMTGSAVRTIQGVLHGPCHGAAAATIGALIAVAELHHGDAKRVIVVGAPNDSVSCAVVLVLEPEGSHV